jgi:hypothetical protein
VGVKVWGPFAVVCAIAVVRAMTANAPSPAPDSDEDLLRQAFRAIASQETSMRHEGAKTFPTDPWSRDDDFHKQEANKARDWGGNHHARTGDVLFAIDEGIRMRWPHGNSAPLVTTTPPCRPRAIY